MKKIHTVAILLLIIITSCIEKKHHNIFSPKFKKTREMLTNKVDSALYNLLDIKDSINTYYNDPYLVNEYHILLAEAQFKNQYKQMLPSYRKVYRYYGSYRTFRYIYGIYPLYYQYQYSY